MGRRLAATALGLLALSAPAAAKKPPRCPPGAFAVQGAALVSGVAFGTGTVVLGDDTVTIGPDCAARAGLKGKRRFTRVRGRFGRCGSFRGAQLVAKIESPDCNQMVGTLKPAGAPVRGFLALRVRCGDGRFDAGAEECDGAGCGAGAICTSKCQCAPVTTTSTSTTSTSTRITATSTTTSSTTSSTTTPTLNFSLPPVYGSTALTSGFVPDPFTVGITAGGPANANYLGGGCYGHTTSAPSFSVNYTKGAFPTLRLYFIGSGDTTLIINTPGGSFVCVDDSFGTLNPTIDFNTPSSGRYHVWVATYAQGASIGGTLYVTENTGNHP